MPLRSHRTHYTRLPQPPSSFVLVYPRSAAGRATRAVAADSLLTATAAPEVEVAAVAGDSCRRKNSARRRTQDSADFLRSRKVKRDRLEHLEHLERRARRGHREFHLSWEMHPAR